MEESPDETTPPAEDAACPHRLATAPGGLVAAWVVAVVGAGEANRTSGASMIRRTADQVQRALLRLDPRSATVADWSIGRYQIRPATARAALHWACASDAVCTRGCDHRPSGAALVRQILDPAGGIALVQVILARLRDNHPCLRTMSWEQIEASDQAIAKLFSGWLGAGGFWTAWRADCRPGPLACRYLHGTEDGRHCAVVQALRPPDGPQRCGVVVPPRLAARSLEHKRPSANLSVRETFSGSAGHATTEEP